MKNLVKAAFQAATVQAAFRGRKMDENVLKKNFFELDNEELAFIEYLRKVFNYRGDNNLGRSKTRQWFYHLQKGLKELPF